MKMKNENEIKEFLGFRRNRITMRYITMTPKKEIHGICKIYRLSFYRFGHKQNCIKIQLSEAIEIDITILFFID